MSNCKNEKEGDTTLHYIDILAMYCRVLSLCIFAVLSNGHREVCLFACLGFNGTFSTNRLYRAI